jgi:anti-sigma-K factor RskA
MLRLLQLNRRPTFSEAEEKEAEACLRMWARRHRWRFIEYVISWTAGMAALLALVGGW